MDKAIIVVIEKNPSFGTPELPVSVYHLDKIFHPSSVAVIGASPREGIIRAALLEGCLEIARGRGFRSVWAIAPAENTRILALGKHLGYNSRCEPGSGDYQLGLDVK